MQAFQLYARAGLAADAFAYSGLISAAGKAGEMEAAAAALANAVEEGACDDGVFNAYVDACARRGDYSSAADTVVLMRSVGVHPNVRTYNSLITAASRANNLPAAKAALAELDADPRGLEATDRTYGSALSAAANAAVDGTENVRWALEVYARADAAGLGANNHAVSSLLTALARGVAAGAWPADDAVARAVGIVESLVGPAENESTSESERESENESDTSSTNSSSSRRGRDGGFQRRGSGGGKKKEEKVLNAAVWSALMSVCARGGRAREALDALALMRRRGYPLEPYTLASVGLAALFTLFFSQKHYFR